MNLALTALLTYTLSIVFFLLEERTPFKKLDYKWRQIIIGFFFGVSACLATEFGTPINGAVINVRTAAPICAGLFFGGPAGIIAGCIGGIHRWLAVYWGAGAYTRIACSVSTAVAGFVAAFVRKDVLGGKRPTWPYALAIGITIEVFHMLMVFITNMTDTYNAFIIMQKCAAVMITACSVTCTVTALTISLLSRENKRKKGLRHISVSFQRVLLICMLIALVVSTMFIRALQTNLAEANTERMLSLYISDVEAEINKVSGDKLLMLTRNIVGELNQKKSYNDDDLVELAKKYDVSEVSYVNEDGIITISTRPDYIGFDMSSGEQAAEFLCLLDGEKEFVQEFREITYDDSVAMKYAGIAFKDGGFLQVGYDLSRFQHDVELRIIDLTENRHVGEGGMLLIINPSGHIISGSVEGMTTVDIDAISGTLKPGALGMAEFNGTQYYYMYRMCTSYCILSVMPYDEAQIFRDMSFYVIAFMLVIIFAMLFLNTYWAVKRQVVDNIDKINGTLGEITAGNLDAVVDVRTHEEFASLSDDINATVDTLKDYIAAEAERIAKDLDMAKSVQHSALPSVFPPYPNRSDFDIYASMHTAKEVGGDFYDFYFTEGEKLAFLIADVSGKGIPAAMFMMTAKTTIKALAESGIPVNEVLTAANEKLCESNESGMFVTCWMGIIDLKTGLVTFANAGHNPPLVCRAGGKFEYYRTRPGLVLAGMDGIRYRIGEIQLEPGDKIFLYTDGVTEATDAHDELYNEDRLLNALASLTDCDMQSLCAGVKTDVDAFVGEAPQFDDITMVALHYKGEKQ